MQYAPALGDTVEDIQRQTIGRVMGFVGPYVQLRPVDGGREWDARREWLRPVSLTEALSAGVAAANARSRGQALVTANTSLPVDTATMYATTALVLDEKAELPTADELNNLTLLYRGHLMLLIPEVEKAGLGLPEDDTARRRAHAGVAEARTRLNLEAGPTLPAQVAHAQRLARSVVCLLGHLENPGRAPDRPNHSSAKEDRVSEPTQTAFGMTVTDLNQIVRLGHPEGPRWRLPN
ncbi:DUF6415 family natural product biosynthesis protein [Streptomyces umbrinus]|uniref:DUF6415 family natural product biosynthesis protein n=1 Tax=Streptomyces umbrinus TaxID=67370 RepID=UPI003C2C74B0